MRKILLNSIIGLSLVASMASCGDKFLETDYTQGEDVDTFLGDVDHISYALNGTYYQLCTYYFAGNYATTLGDIASDIVYWTGNNNHQNDLYEFTYTDSSTTLYYVWDYGYKVVDNAARVIEACKNLLPDSEGYDTMYLMLYEAEARCLRAYANLAMVNIFAHQVMVDGTSYANMPGLVISETPIKPYQEVSRSTIGQTYDFIVNDLLQAIDTFEYIGDQGDLYYFGEASAKGLLARTYMYLEDWQNAADYAEAALDVAGISTLTYSVEDYYRLYENDASDVESMFALAIDDLTNWSANSCGTLFSTYGYSISPYLLSLYDPEDCRLPLLDEWEIDNYYYYDPFDDNYYGGKFYFNFGNNAYATNYLINAPEMFLIEAEAYANMNQISAAQDALLVVAKRNNAITSVSDLPSTQEGILEFLYDERARELFQEGFRFFDLRRWNIECNLYAVDAPDIDWMYTDQKIGDVVLPIPVDEILAGYGVEQNQGWSSTKPQR